MKTTPTSSSRKTRARQRRECFAGLFSLLSTAAVLITLKSWSFSTGQAGVRGLVGETDNPKDSRSDGAPPPTPPPTPRADPRRVAVCFFGLTRSLRWTLPSIEKRLLGVMRGSGMEVDVFVHTYHLVEVGPVCATSLLCIKGALSCHVLPERFHLTRDVLDIVMRTRARHWGDGMMREQQRRLDFIVGIFFKKSMLFHTRSFLNNVGFSVSRLSSYCPRHSLKKYIKNFPRMYFWVLAPQVNNRRAGEMGIQYDDFKNDFRALNATRLAPAPPPPRSPASSLYLCGGSSSLWQRNFAVD